MNDDIVMVTRTCDECGFPILAPTGAPCPYCDTHATSAQFAKRMQAALYGLPLATLQRVKLALRSQAPAAASEAHAPLAEWIASRDGNLATIIDVLVALYVISEEPATPDELTEVIAKVTQGNLSELPLPRRSPCFCDSGRRYKKCHGRTSR